MALRRHLLLDPAPHSPVFARRGSPLLIQRALLAGPRDELSVDHGRVARTINPKTTLGALPSVFEGGAFEFAFFPLVSQVSKPFSTPNSRSTLIFGCLLKNT